MDGVVLSLDPGSVNEVQIVYTRPKLDTLRKVSGSHEVYEILKDIYPSDRITYKEFFYAVFLNAGNYVLAVSKVSEGGMMGTIVDLREVFQLALKLSATIIILSHNHPIGNLRPSHTDKLITRKIVEAGKILDITVYDHLIVTQEGYFSFADEGLL
tara:strand:- start:1249 stop:1716 length:468 start_codon:yes stop_codon:yes gene_type:complete